MKFLLYSQCGEGAQFLHRIQAEGNDVGLFIKDKMYKTVWDGILPHVDSPESFIDKDTVIIFDMSGNGSIADRWKKAGHLVYGGASFADMLEHDRKFGFDAMKKVGINTPETKEFKDFKQGIEFVRGANKRLVFKPSGSMPCKLTYSSAEDSDELVKYMQFVEKKFGREIESFVLQEFIEGVVVSSEFFCDGTKFLHPSNHTVEVKKSMNDDLGPSTGCSGNIVWLADQSQIVANGVAKIEQLCVENGYVGQIDLNVVANEEGLWGLEWTPRFGYDATPTLFAILEMDFGQFFSDVCHGQMGDMPFRDTYVGGVRLTIPPYPAEPKGDPEKLSPNIGTPIQNWEDFGEHCYFFEVMLEDDILVHSGGTGVILCATSADDDCENCLNDAYEIVEEVKVPDKQYRTDLDKVLPEMVEEVIKYV